MEGTVEICETWDSRTQVVSRPVFRHTKTILRSGD